MLFNSHIIVQYAYQISTPHIIVLFVSKATSSLVLLVYHPFRTVLHTTETSYSVCNPNFDIAQNCAFCLKGYELSGTTCIPCATHSGTSCCINGYFMSNGVCTAVSLPNCAVYNGTSCSICNAHFDINTGCTLCLLGYVLALNGTK